MNNEMTHRDFSDSMLENRTEKSIELDTILMEDKNYIEFENRNCVINISIEELITYAQERRMDSICQTKKLVLEEIITNLINSNSNYYYIDKEISPEQYKELKYTKPGRYRKIFIEPYGYSSMIDTIGKFEFELLKNWIISEMCIEGKCLVMDKRNNDYTDTIYYEVIDFKDGHGAEYLTFSDKKPFLNVEIYSSILWPDFDCMTKEEIEKWENN